MRLTASAGLVLVAFAVGLDLPASAQRPAGMTRRVATVGSVLAYPIFYHQQPIRLLGDLATDKGVSRIFSGEKTEKGLVIVPQRAGDFLPADGESSVEVLGLVFDLGRLEPNDARLASLDAKALSQRVTGKDWPGVGELVVLVAESVTAATPPIAPSIRSIALNPDRYEGQTVSVIGRFRGRNLYGDLPASPGKSQWDFVVQSADASLWVTGLRPRGRGFELKTDARVDTSRFVEVRGTVRSDRSQIWLEGTYIELAQPPAESAQPEAIVQVPAGPNPDVIFSTPVEGEIDVSRDSAIRIQFSRDMESTSFTGRVKVRYLIEIPGEQTPTPATASIRYDEGRRVLEIRFSGPLEPLQKLRVDLEEGIASRDGAMLKPWSLTFSLGG